MDGAAKGSPLYAKYGTRVEAESAREKLAARMEKATAAADAEPADGQAAERGPKSPTPAPLPAAPMRSGISGSREGKAMQRKVLRGVFGMLKKQL